MPPDGRGQGPQRVPGELQEDEPRGDAGESEEAEGGRAGIRKVIYDIAYLDPKIS